MDEEPTTRKLDVVEVAPTTEVEPAPPVEAESVHARVAEVRDRLEASGWVDAAAAAGLGFLVLLAVGSVLVLAAKLNFPSLGGGSDPLDAFTAIVIAGLSGLGTPILLDGLAVSALPLGALLCIGFGIMWAVGTSRKDAGFPTVVAAAAHGLRVGLPFGLLCWFFALVFRFRGQHPVSSSAWIALLAGLFWGALFGVLGSVRVMETLAAAARRISSGLRARDRSAYEGVATGTTMLSAAAVLGAAATLLWIIVSLTRGAPGRHFGAGDAFAYLVYLLAFLPNVVIAIVSFSLGAPVAVGAKVNLRGKLVGPLSDYSLTSWGRGNPPAVVWFLVLVPIFVFVLGGFVARRRASDAKTMLPVMLIGSAVFAVTITLLAAIGELRLAGISKGAGYAMVAPDIVLLLLFAFLESGVFGVIGWKLAERPGFLRNRYPQAR
jgi:hypothetical protein